MNPKITLVKKQRKQNMNMKLEKTKILIFKAPLNTFLKTTEKIAKTISLHIIFNLMKITPPMKKIYQQNGKPKTKNGLLLRNTMIKILR